MSAVTERLFNLGITLPPPAKAVAAYVPFVIADNLLVISGQLPMRDGKVVFTGKLGDRVDVTTGMEAAALSAINVLAQISAALEGDFDRVKRVVRLGGFIACSVFFSEHSRVMNGASELFQNVFGEDGRHARTTIGVASLPMDACCEVEALVQLR